MIQLIFYSYLYLRLKGREYKSEILADVTFDATRRISDQDVSKGLE